LGDLGADVVRIDRASGTGTGVPEHLDVLRRSRRSVSLNLREPRGVSTFLTLVESADVVIDVFRPGVAERLGIGPTECRARNPRLVYGRMTGWGQDGLLASSAGHDLSYIAVTGALHAMGRHGEPPAIPLNLVGDFGGGALYLVSGILAALLERERSGRGQVVDAAIVDGTAHLLGMFHGMLAAGVWKDERGVNVLDGGVPWYDTYRTSDGGYVAVGALEPPFYAELMTTLGLDPDPRRRADRARWPEIRMELTSTFGGRTRDHWAEVFAGTDACVAPVLSLREAAEHPHMRHRRVFTTVDGTLQAAPAPRFSRTPGAIQSPPVRSGQHTREVLEGWGVDDVDSLIADGVAQQL
jgi:alpha-methylacyl-CoA racemase